MEEELITPKPRPSILRNKLEEKLEADWDESVGKPTNTIKKNSLDSDEEDDGEERNYEILDDDDIEGQEEGIAGLDGEVQITPFNMKEELEEGHFDTDGNYHWNREKQLRDNWLENIDWVKIKKPTGEEKKEESDSDDSDSGIAATFDQVPVYKQMLDLMQPGETVAKALRRLGGSKTMSASERWKRKKAGQPVEDSNNQQQVTDLTELANRLLTKMGNMDIYQESYEIIKLKVSNMEKKSVIPPTPATPQVDALDMYADDFDEQEEKRREEVLKRKATDDGGESSQTDTKRSKMEPEENSTAADQESTEVKWEFKWDKTSSEIHGPHTSAEMQGWVDQGYFKEVWVRKCGTEGDFYTSQRIDFELYL